MKKKLRLRDDEGGYVLVFVGMSMLAFVGASMLAIDVGMLATARSQAQNAADAGALAGAVALAFDDFNDRSTDGPVVQSAITAAQANEVINDTVSIEAGDVTFPADPSGAPNRVRVAVFRNAARGNALANVIAAYFGMPTADVTAVATAEAAVANAGECVLPFAIPDKWTERQTPAWDPNDTFSAYPANPSVLPDLYVAASQSAYTGYKPDVNKGLLLTIKPPSGTVIRASGYYPMVLPGSSGASDYISNIANCNSSVLAVFDLLTVETGNLAAATQQGVEELIAQDPGAYWDAANNRVVSTMNPSPRIKLMPVFDPYYYDTGKKNGILTNFKAANLIGVFIEGIQGTDVKARVVPMTGKLLSGGPSVPNAFPRAIRLVE